MHSLEDTICAIATPPGNGAIAVLRLSGKHAKSIANNLFSKNLDVVLPNSLHYGKIIANGELVDEVVLSYFQSPNSYTGQDVIEISCHGSVYIQNKLLEAIIAEGARLAEPGEFTQRAFLNKKMDLSQAEAVADLIAAESKATHQLALQQMRGGYSAEIEQLRQELIDFASLIELELDFGEEDVEFADRKKLLALIDTIQQKIGPLIESFKYGNVIKNGVQTVIAGRPNAGKSTLLNTLLKEDRAIVSEVAGTTRDTIEEVINIKGTLFRLIDTAGIRDATDTIEKIGVEKARQKVQQSAALLYVFDCNELTPAEVLKDVQSLQHENLLILLLANKYDIGNNLQEEAWKQFEEKYTLHKISAKNGTGVEEVLAELESKFNTENKGHSLVVTNTRHYEALQNAQAALEKTKENLQQNVSGDFVAMDIREALRHLGTITGAVDVDKDILGNIFGKFCIGK